MAARWLRPSPALSVVGVLALAPALVTWDASVQVNDVSAGQQDRPAAALSGEGTAHLVWDDYRSGSNGDIFYARRDPATGAWSANEKVNDDATTRTQWNAAVAVDAAGTVYAIWQDQRDGRKTPDTNIYFSRRSPSGGWSANVRVNDDTRGTASQIAPRIAVTAGGIGVAVWEDHRSRGWTVYSSNLSAGGAWSANLPVTDDGISRKFTPDVAIGADGTAYAVWEDDRAGDSDIWFATLAPGAAAWSANQRVSDDPGTAAQYEPRIGIAAGGDLLVAWLDDRGTATAVRASRRLAGTSTWEASRVVSDAGAVPVALALAVASGGSAFATWQDARGTSHDVWGAEYDTATDAWLAPAVVGDAAEGVAEMRPATARADATLLVAWRDDRQAGGDIRVRIGIAGAP